MVPMMPSTGVLGHAGREGERELSRRSSRYEALGEDVGRHLVDGGREPENVVSGASAVDDDRLELGLAERERAGLVEQHRPRRRRVVRARRHP